MAYQVFQGLGYLFVGAVIEGVAEVFAVDLAFPQERAQSRVEDLRAGARGSDQTSGSYQNSPAPAVFSGRPPRAAWRRMTSGSVSTAKAMLVAGDLALSNLLHGLFPGNDLFLAPLDSCVGFPGAL